jgi:hypothetical protein
LTSDLSVPRSRSHASAWQRGYAARLAGDSIYANPYAVAIEHEDALHAAIARLDGVPVQREGGWRYGFLHAWWQGWRVADELLRPSG